MNDRIGSIFGRQNRRRLLKGLGLGTLGAAGAAVLPGEARAQRGGLDIPVLNFALNLEYLEAEYYTLAVTGQSIVELGLGIDGMGMTGPLTVKDDPQVSFDTPLIEQYAEEIALDERNHVQFLRAALGPMAVARPAINLRESFDAAITAATDGAVTEFDPFANEVNFLLGAFIFEDVGVTAYKGGARLLANRNFLEAAAGILAVEAYHAGEVRTVLAARDAAEPGLGIAGTVEAISDARDFLDGDGDKDEPIFLGGDVNIVPADAFSIAFSRTVAEVLNIVYLDLTRSQTPGGFFPMGLNGPLR